LQTRRRRIIEPGVGKWVSYLNREKKLDTLVGQRPVAPVAPKGLYLYGNVGSGGVPLTQRAQNKNIYSHVRFVLYYIIFFLKKMLCHVTGLFSERLFRQIYYRKISSHYSAWSSTLH
jgi:hypothetical protein